MLLRLPVLLLALFVSFSPLHASAQILEEDESTYIYKGFFVTAEYGAYILALKPTSLAGGGPRQAQSESIGHLSGFDLGYDIASSFALQFSFWATNIRGNSQYGGGNATLLFNLGATIYAVKTGRLFIYGKLGAGLMLTLPAGILPLGLMVHGGLGIRYYTKMKHFSFGLEARALVRPPIDDAGLSLGIGILPSIMYTF